MRDFFKKVWIVTRACCDCKLNAEEEEVLLGLPLMILRPVLFVCLNWYQFPEDFDCRKIFELPLDKIVAVLTIACKRDHNIMRKPEVQSNIFKLPVAYAEKFGMWIITNVEFDEDAQSDMLTVAENDSEKRLPLEVVIRLVRACIMDCDNDLKPKARKKLVELLAKYPDNEELIELVLKYKSDDDVQCGMLTVADDENKEGLPLDLAIRLVCATIDNGQELCSKAFCMLLALVAKYPTNEDLINLVIRHIILWHKIDPEAESAMLTVAEDSNSEGLPFEIVLRLVEEFVPIGRRFKSDKKLIRLLAQHSGCEALVNTIEEYVAKHGLDQDGQMEMLDLYHDGKLRAIVIRLLKAHINLSKKVCASQEELEMKPKDLLVLMVWRCALWEVAVEKLLRLLIDYPESEELADFAVTYLKEFSVHSAAEEIMLDTSNSQFALPIDLATRLLVAYVIDGKHELTAVVKLFELVTRYPDNEDGKRVFYHHIQEADLPDEAISAVFTLPDELCAYLLLQQARRGFSKGLRDTLIAQIYLRVMKP